MPRPRGHSHGLTRFNAEDKLLAEMVEVDGPLPTQCWVPKHELYHVGDKLWKAARLAWTLFEGKIPDGLNVCHKCDNWWCINTEHMFLGTQLENMRDAIAKGRFKGFRRKV